MPTLSIIMPTLNEAANLPQTIPHTRDAANGTDVEILVSDCGSRDGTAAVAERLGTRVLGGGSSRATALNIGAAAARGQVLLFLHADSLLPHGFPRLIQRALRDAGTVGGAFDFEFGEHPQSEGFAAQCLRWVVLCNRIRYRWTGNYYGDQSIFVRREAFHRVGGFPQVRLMEDIGFSRRMRGLGRTAILRPPVRTSPRRFVTRGVVRQFVEDLTLLGCDNFGVCPVNLWERYNGWNRRGGESTNGGSSAG